MNKLITILTATTMTLGVSQITFALAPQGVVDGVRAVKSIENSGMPQQAKEAVGEKESSTTSQ